MDPADSLTMSYIIPYPAVKGIYRDRTFFVTDAGQTSAEHKQEFGICQGCPLSPFLFVIVMTVLISDARVLLSERAGEVDTEELLYADDTLLIDRAGGHVQDYMECIHEIGAEYGLSFNWGKLEVLTVRCRDVIKTPDGSAVKNKASMVYLGSLLSEDGYTELELSRRIGAARADFDALRRLWSHANVPREDKLRVFNACVMSKLMYALHTAWLNVAARRRLDGFQARCLRRIVGIEHSYLSRVSNAEVLKVSGAKSASSTLLRSQLRLFGRVATCNAAANLRKELFEPGCLDIKRLDGDRRQGRPRNYWPQMVRSHAVAAAGSECQLNRLLGPEPRRTKKNEWEEAVRRYIQRMQ